MVRCMGVNGNWSIFSQLRQKETGEHGGLFLLLSSHMPAKETEGSCGWAGTNPGRGRVSAPPIAAQGPLLGVRPLRNTWPARSLHISCLNENNEMPVIFHHGGAPQPVCPNVKGFLCAARG